MIPLWLRVVYFIAALACAVSVLVFAGIEDERAERSAIAAHQ